MHNDPAGVWPRQNPLILRDYWEKQKGLPGQEHISAVWSYQTDDISND